ncbi:MAG: lipoprotein-releasing ABC transporter permease subunit [Rickettsiales bacterium]|jgi:lipoprotein-releasing system permease protein|nr:lipoprotein-releasing ABC transporter permease subunit [Rickettsiales bacterium]
MSLLKYEFFIALRYLKDRRKDKFISLTTYFSFLGIALGVGTLIVVMSVMNGFREELVGKIIGINAHISIFPRGESAKKYEDIINSLRGDADIEYINPLIESPVMLSNGSIAIGGLVKAIRPEDLKRKGIFYRSMKNGEKIGDFDGKWTAVVGNRLADSLALDRGDSLRIISPGSGVTVFGVIPRVKTYKIFDKFESGMYEYDTSVVFIPFQMGQKQFGLIDSASGIEIFLRNADSTAEKMREIGNKLRALGYDFTLVDWKNANAGLITALNTERNVMFLILALIIIVAAFNIITGLVMLVMDKKKQIALLKTIGATSGSIVRIFFICGSTIGFLGTASGVLLGCIFASNIENLRIVLESVFRVNLFNPVVYYLSQLPSRVYVADVLWISGVSMIISILAAIYPSLRASRVSPADILRNE